MQFTMSPFAPNFRLLSKDALDAIHFASLDILDTVGVKVESEKYLKMLEDAGCKVDHTNRTAAIPSYLVEESLSKTQKRFNLFGRNPKNNLSLGDGIHNFVLSLGGATNTLDLETGERRPSTKEDLSKATRIEDYLDTFSLLYPLVEPQDSPPNIKFLHTLEVLYTQTEKPTGYWPESPAKVKYIVDALAAIAGGKEELRKKPMTIFLIDISSPLTHIVDQLDSAIELVKAGLPVNLQSMAMAGATAPVTLAGCLAQANAELLSGIVIIQLACPGAKMTYALSAASFDMRYGAWNGGSPETGLLAVAGYELASYYGMVGSGTGFGTNAKIPGVQAAFEKVISGAPLLFASKAKISGPGLLENGKTLSFEQLVIDNDIIKMLLRVKKGIEVSEESLAVEVIKRVGHGGNFLTDRHTLDNFRKECVTPDLERSEVGARSIVTTAREKIKEILRKHHPMPLEEGIQKELSAIMQRAQKELSKASLT